MLLLHFTFASGIGGHAGCAEFSFLQSFPSFPSGVSRSRIVKSRESESECEDCYVRASGIDRQDREN